MNENDLKILISVYQQKSSELFAQNIAQEARIIHSNQLIEALTNKVNEQKEEIEKLKQRASKRKVDNEDI